MVRFPEAEVRLIKNKFVCRRCGSVKRSQMRVLLAGKLTCRRCKCHAFKPKRKK